MQNNLWLYQKDKSDHWVYSELKDKHYIIADTMLTLLLLLPLVIQIDIFLVSPSSLEAELFQPFT